MRAQDEADFAAFVTGVSARLFRTAYAMCGDRQLAEDAVQSALTSACVSWRRVRGARSPEAYVRRIVVNEVLRSRRRKSWRSERLFAAVPDRALDTQNDGFLAHDAAWQLLGTLPPRQRAVLVLRYYEDLSEREIADVLGIRPGTVKSQASAGLEHLRQALPAFSRSERGSR
jgi:RNA polymerase sigma-70 factor (sigma-E family)